jgi:hypothetical protein
MPLVSKHRQYGSSLLGQRPAAGDFIWWLLRNPVRFSRRLHSESRDHYELVKSPCQLWHNSSFHYAILLHRSRLDIVRLVRHRIALFSKISSNGTLRDQHLNNCNTGLVLSLDGLTLPGTKNRYAMDGAMVWNRTDWSILSRNRCRRIDWGAGRLLVHSKAAAPQITDVDS